MHQTLSADSFLNALQSDGGLLPVISAEAFVRRVH